ncbi:Lrp/AsnC family transcriptional regulator [Chromohalobacter canadensis]|uniref:Leucine-responsive regulatory protein n=1 Tax=Chromohalobacter canadensis TaxID=141389 RepID=A0A285VJU7_9GAMM|nr:Lrp/AsnC family transcriptional regulator [Chromohalobacter canadensis]WQH08426.1 Lrp/AsnC family transcriptional regulator [Chromohalobacter canadensis]SOC54352.1 transcriptional regulator, AsnC family [Chromohalobacter canadensis]
MDAVDRRILQVLTQDGRISNVQLAERVALSPSACLRRVQELERTGVIRGYRAVTDPQRMGRGFVAYVTVGLSSHTKAAQETFERAMYVASDVVECHNIAGTFEYLLRVESQDLASYKRFHTEMLGTQPHVSAITTHIVMSSPKDERR